MTKIERWHKIPGHKNYYVSSFGRIWSSKSEKFLEGYLHQSNRGVYRRVTVDSKRYMVHKLVAQAFLKKPCGSYDIVDHWDGNTLNNNVYNLEYVTQSENIKRWHERIKGPNQ